MSPLAVRERVIKIRCTRYEGNRKWEAWMTLPEADFFNEKTKQFNVEAIEKHKKRIKWVEVASETPFRLEGGITFIGTGVNS